jgi:uncharacterized protein YdeI (YjbR/CyaY-like superfamily)
MTTPPTYFDSAEDFRAWLSVHGGTEKELLVGFHKLHTGRATLTWPQSVDEALCFGWIDGKRQRIDNDRYAIRFTPRRPDSHWSAVNIQRVIELQDEGRMQPAGMRAFLLRTESRSKKAAYEQEDFPELSAEQTREFKRNKSAWSFYQKLPAGYRKKVNWHIISAKQEATRERRFQALVAACADGKRL